MLFSPHKQHCEVGTELVPIVGEEMETLRHSQGHVASRQEGQSEKAERRLNVWGQRKEPQFCLGPGRRGAGVLPPVLRREQPSQVSPLPQDDRSWSGSREHL